MGAPESVVEASYIDDSYNNKNNYKTALIPKKRKLNGPLSASKQSRFYKGYYVLYLLGCYLFFFILCLYLKVCFKVSIYAS
jgi:hypothetical protein